MHNELPIEIVKDIVRACLYSGCHDPALEDSDLCGPHDAHERGRAAARQRRHRQKLANAGLCIAGCGRRVPRKRGRGGKVRKLRCSKCRTKHNADAREARAKACVTGGDRGVTGAPDDSHRWRPDFDPVTGAPIRRWRGKARRGRLTREEQLDEDIRDLRHAIEYLEEAQRRISRLKAAVNLPAIQREAAWRLAGEPIGSASRQLDELAEKYL